MKNNDAQIFVHHLFYWQNTHYFLQIK